MEHLKRLNKYKNKKCPFPYSIIQGIGHKIKKEIKYENEILYIQIYKQK